jgi:L-lactate dehydrogenase (cytochrome)
MAKSDHSSGVSKRVFVADDARRLSKRRLPRLVFDFIDGAAGREKASARNEAMFDELFLQPRVMEDVSVRCLKTCFLGQEYDLPFGIAPMGMCNLVCPGADKIIADEATRHNIPACLSTAASSSIEEMAMWAGENAWFQLYVGGSAEQAMDLVERARVAGYRNLILTVDVPQVSRRVREMKNGFSMPFRLGPRQFLDFATHPAWSLAMLLHGAPEPKNFAYANDETKFDRSASRAGANWDFLNRLREIWQGNLIVKGVTSVADALRIKTAGADAIYVSTHGGRQLDSAPPALQVLPHIRQAVGPDFPLIMDSGVRSGEDVVKALAAGADFVMLGRPILFALGAEARLGLSSLIRILSEETSITMAQIGRAKIDAIDETSLLNLTGLNQQAVSPKINFTRKHA